MKTSIADLKVGERGTIVDFSFDKIPLILLEMGCLPGINVELIQVAPLKDPLYLRVNGSHLAIRRDTARKIIIDKI